MGSEIFRSTNSELFFLDATVWSHVPISCRALFEVTLELAEQFLPFRLIIIVAGVAPREHIPWFRPAFTLRAGDGCG